MRLVGPDQPSSGLPTLSDGTVTLRRPRAGDAEQRFRQGQDPAILRMFGADPRDLPPWSSEQAADWVAQQQGCEYGWIIETQDELVGACRLHSLNSRDQNARLAVGLTDPARLSQGIGRRAVRLMLDHAFHTMQLHRIELRVLDFNTRAIRCYERCGFRREGILRQSARIGDTWYDDIIMAKLAQDHLR